MAPNSLYGAMAIGGMALAFRLREKWPELELNETHPKVLLHALGGPRYEQKRQETVDAAIQGLSVERIASRESFKGSMNLTPLCPHGPHEKAL